MIALAREWACSRFAYWAIRVVLDGAERTVVPGRQRLLLARLALAEGRFVQVDQLIDDLWENRPPSSAANAVQVYVSSVRKLLGSTAGRTRGRSYAVDGAAVIDVAQFRQEITTGFSAGALPGAAAALKSLERGLDRSTGHPLQDLEDVGFVQAARAELTDLYLSGIEVRCAARSAEGRPRRSCRSYAR